MFKSKHRMYLFKTVESISRYLAGEKRARRSIGFVPTMGALHDGHFSLIKASLQRDQVTVCSVFVNPTQFNEKSDLEKYPRTPSKDIDNLIRVGCQALFFPPAEEIYPQEGQVPAEPHLDLGNLVRVMEGEFRPGHFEGVAQVVHRLLTIVGPNRIYMGQKDYQQVQVVREMMDQTGIRTEMVMCPIVREEDGLAMSSRNVRLLPEIRPKANVIYQTLDWARLNHAAYAPQELRSEALGALSSAGLKPEYFEIADARTLEPVRDYGAHEQMVICAAAWAGDVRLIDNMIL